MMLRLMFVLRRRWPVLVAVPLLLGAVAWLAGPQGAPDRKPDYASTVTIAVDEAGTNQVQVAQVLATSTIGRMADEIADRAGHGATAFEVPERISTDFDPESFVATVTARADTPQAASRYAKAYAAVFVPAANRNSGDMARMAAAAAAEERRAAQARLGGFEPASSEPGASEDATSDAPPPMVTDELVKPDPAATDTARAGSTEDAPTPTPTPTSTSTPTTFEVISVSAARAQAPGALEVFDNPRIRLVMALALGLVLAGLFVVAAERMNPRVDLPAQAEALVGAPVLAMVPMLRRGRRGLIKRVDPADFRGPFAESFRTMRSHLDFRASTIEGDQSPRIMVTSAHPSEGKSTTAAFLALSYAESDRKPLVIGGDLRRPTIHRLFGIDRIPGLTSRSLAAGGSMPLTSLVHRDPTSGVAVVPSGPSVDRVGGVLRDVATVTEVAQATGQVVIVDTAPVQVANDAVDFLSVVDWVVIVVRAGRSTRRSVAQMMHTLRMNGAEVVGVVMVGSIEASDASTYYYSYYAPERERRRFRRPEPHVAPAAAH